MNDFGLRISDRRLSRRRAPGFTLVEIMVVMAIIGLLVVVVAWAGGRSRDAAKVRKTLADLAVIQAAMADFRSVAGFEVMPPADPDDMRVILPPVPANMQDARVDFYRRGDGTPGNWLNEPAAQNGVRVNPASPRPMVLWAVNGRMVQDPQLRIYGIQALYYALMSEPSSKAILSKLPESSFGQASTFWTQTADNLSHVVDGGGTAAQVMSARVIVDAWGKAMYYGRDPRVNSGQFYVQSAGPDGLWGNDDDLYSFKGN